VVEGVVERLVRGFEASIPALKKGAHIGGNQSIRESVECAFALDITQIKSRGGIQVNDPSIAGDSSNARLLGGILKGYEFHKGEGRIRGAL
jgi:hypothetical protein